MRSIFKNIDRSILMNGKWLYWWFGIWNLFLEIIENHLLENSYLKLINKNAFCFDCHWFEFPWLLMTNTKYKKKRDFYSNNKKKKIDRSFVRKTRSIWSPIIKCCYDGKDHEIIVTKIHNKRRSFWIEEFNIYENFEFPNS